MVYCLCAWLVKSVICDQILPPVLNSVPTYYVECLTFYLILVVMVISNLTCHYNLNKKLSWTPGVKNY